MDTTTTKGVDAALLRLLRGTTIGTHEVRALNVSLFIDISARPVVGGGRVNGLLTHATKHILNDPMPL